MEIATIHDLQREQLKESILNFEGLLKQIDEQIEKLKVQKFVAQVSLNALNMKLDELT